MPTAPMTPVRMIARGWEYESKDGVWHYEREESPGTPWVVTYLPTREWTYYASLPKARRGTESGIALATIEARRTQPAREDSAP